MGMGVCFDLSLKGLSFGGIFLYLFFDEIYDVVFCNSVGMGVVWYKAKASGEYV